MAETDAPDVNVIKVEEEIEGDQIGTRNYRFSKIGESVPIKSDADFKFDMDSLPSRPLAVSEHSGVVFVAHSSGFCVAKIKDVVGVAEELKNGGKGSSIQDQSVVDVSLGKVSILALSADSSMLAATVGFDLHFFSVDCLLNKDGEPSFSKSLSDSSLIKDMQWSPRLKNRYVVLTSDGSLYRAAGQDDPNKIMENVDAVNWSRNGKFLAVAKNDHLIILSSKFKEKLRIKLRFDSLVDGSDADFVAKVDSVRWVRSDCIILGCHRLSADGKEETYLVQFISVKDDKITNPSSNPVALAFSDAFLSINDDEVPSGSGPYMFLSYLDEGELAFVANRKNTDQHIVLFNWSPDKEHGAEMIEISNDAWLPTINLQDNSDDNLILGLAVDKSYKDEKIRFVLGEQDTEVSPCCMLLCLTVDAKLFMFHFASATGPSVLPEDSDTVSDEEEQSPPLTSQINDDKQNKNQALDELQPQKVKVNESSADSVSKSENDKSFLQQDVSVTKLNSNKDPEKSVPSQKEERDAEVAVSKPSAPVISESLVKDVKSFGNQEADSVTKSTNEKSNKPLFGAPFGNSKANTDSSVNKPLFSLQGSSGSFSSGPLFSSSVFGVQSAASQSVAHGTADFSSKTGSTNPLASSGLFSSGGLFSLKTSEVKSSVLSLSNPPVSSGSFSLKTSEVKSSLLSPSNSPVSSGSFSLKTSEVKSSLLSPSNQPVSSGSFSLKTSDVKSPILSHTPVQGNHPDTTQLSSGPQKFSFSKMNSGQSTSSNLLGQGASTGARVNNSSPVVSSPQPSQGKSSDFRFSDKSNLKSQTPSRLLNSDPNLSEQRTVEEMAKELDTLLDSIVGPGGFLDASVAAHKPSVAALEEGIWALSDRCRNWTETTDQGVGEVQLLLDKTVQVLTRKIYMEAIVKQATDSQYLDIWNRQKLSSELDMKRRHIFEINQNLTNQLIELERHLNTLELQRFGDKGDAQMNRRSSHTKHGPPRHVQSLHSLHNTMNAQLAAAEKLSECLSKQMSVLSIETEPVKKKNVKQELFDTIGISYDGATFGSPIQEKSKEVPLKSKALIPSHSAAASSALKKSQLGAIRTSEPETARRRRDSLDRSWASIEPPKTTVKRMLLQEDRQMSPARSSLQTASQKPSERLSERSFVSHDIPRAALKMSQNRGTQDTQIKRYSEEQSSSSPWSNYRSDLLKTSETSTPSISRDATRDSHDPTAEKSRNRLTFTLKSNPVVVDSKLSQQPQTAPEPSLNTTKSPVTNIFQKKPIEFPQSSTVKSTFAVKPVVNETTSIWSRKSPEPSFPAVSGANSATAFSGKSFSLEATKKESQPSEAVSSSIPTSSPIFPVTSLTPSSFVFKDATSSSLTSATATATSLTGSSTGFGIKPSDTSTSSSLTSATTTLLTGSSTGFGIKLGSTSTSTSGFGFKPPVSIESNTSKPEATNSNTETNESLTPNIVPVPKFDFKPTENTSGQTPPPQPVVSSVPSKPTSFSTSSPELVSNTKPEPPSVSAVVASPAVTDPVAAAVKANENSDEMEEEAPDTSQLSLGSLGGFGLGSAPNPSPPKQNPFGASFGNAPTNTPIASFNSAPTGGGLFKPASFNIESSSQGSPPPQQTSFGGFSGGFGGNNNNNNNQSSGGQGFGQPAKIGSGQQALGSVLGSFGQSRQFGAGLPGNVATPSGFGSGFGGNQGAGGGFASLASGGGGFGGLATGGGGFAAAATGGGGFAAAATGAGGFGSAATGSGGFGGAAAGGGGFGGAAAGGGGFGSTPAAGGFGGAAAGGGFGAPAGGGFGAPSPAGGGFGGALAAGGGFAGAASGGFGGFGSNQGGSGFSTFGSSAGTGRPPSELITQMRK